MEKINEILGTIKGGPAPPAKAPMDQLEQFLIRRYKPRQYPKLAVDYESGKHYFKKFLKYSLLQAGYAAIRTENDLMIFPEANGNKIFPLPKEKREIFDALTRYFLGFEGPLDLSKGIYLVGGFGSGKTRLMEVYQTFLRYLKAWQRFNMTGAEEISETARSKPDALKQFFYKNRCFDDLGHDAVQVKNFGNVIYPIDEILTQRYRLFSSKGQLTHFTSNIFITEDNPEIASLADFLLPKTIDRLQEMVQIVELPGCSLRNQVDRLNN